ncbi:MAG: hypothetical protein HRU15_11065, partial [Planctomycetes bacterium]|nr:hypothetical protein [Planctomycetota bacterium]
MSLLTYAEVAAAAAEKVAENEKKILLVADGSGIRGSGGGMEFSATTGGWGPKWSYMNFKGQAKNEDGDSVATRTANVKGSKAKLSFNSRIKVAGPKKLHATYTVHSSADTTLTMATIFIHPGKKWRGHIEATLADGSTVNKKWPIGKEGVGSAVKSLRLIGEN